MTLSSPPACLQVADGDHRVNCSPAPLWPASSSSSFKESVWPVLVMLVLWDLHDLLGTRRVGREPHFWQGDWSVSLGFS